MAITVKKSMWFMNSDDGIAPPVTRGLIAASQGTYNADSIAYLSESGTWKICAATTGACHGFLLRQQTTELSGNTAIRVGLIKRAHKYLAYAQNAGSDTSLAQANVGNDYEIAVDTTEIGYTTINLATPTEMVLTLTDLAANLDQTGRKFNSSDTPAVGVCQFLQSVIDEEAA